MINDALMCDRMIGKELEVGCMVVGILETVGMVSGIPLSKTLGVRIKALISTASKVLITDMVIKFVVLADHVQWRAVLDMMASKQSVNMREFTKSRKPNIMAKDMTREEDNLRDFQEYRDEEADHGYYETEDASEQQDSEGSDHHEEDVQMSRIMVMIRNWGTTTMTMTAEVPDKRVVSLSDWGYSLLYQENGEQTKAT